MIKMHYGWIVHAYFSCFILFDGFVTECPTSRFSLEEPTVQCLSGVTSSTESVSTIVVDEACNTKE